MSETLGDEIRKFSKKFRADKVRGDFGISNFHPTLSLYGSFLSKEDIVDGCETEVKKSLIEAYADFEVRDDGSIKEDGVGFRRHNFKSTYPVEYTFPHLTLDEAKQLWGSLTKVLRNANRLIKRGKV